MVGDRQMTKASETAHRASKGVLSERMNRRGSPIAARGGLSGLLLRLTGALAFGAGVIAPTAGALAQGYTPDGVPDYPYTGEARARSEATGNGYGRDLDGDGNPATDAIGYYRITPIGEAELDPPFRLLTFEPPRTAHNRPVTTQYKKPYGVSFSPGLFAQLCDGQRYFQYDTSCTYLAPPSGKYAAVYHDDRRRPLQITFDRPICAASLGVIPTGGREGEVFVIALDFYKEGPGGYERIARSRIDVTWTENTFRWRNMIDAFFVDRAADRIDVTIRSRSRLSENFDFLIDDLAFIVDDGLNTGDACRATLGEVAVASGDVTPLLPGSFRP